MSKSFIKKLTFFSIVAILIFYNFHRYIFKYNSENTSPTYTNTPFIWQVLKYIILTMLMSLFYLNCKFKATFNKTFIVIYSIVFFVLLINILSYIIYADLSFSEVEYCFYFFLVMPFWFVKDNWSDLSINYNKTIYISAIILYISNAIVILNFIFFGRLPALGYEGGLVRFGSFWDDPNTYGLICVFCTYFFYFQKKYVLLIISILYIFLTFSFTAYLMLFLSAIFWIYKKPKLLNYKVIISILVFLVLLTFEIVDHYSYVKDLLEAKNGSVNAHLTNALIFNPYPLANAPIQFSETWYISFFYNYFPFSLFGLFCFVILLFWTFKRNLNVYAKFFIFLFVIYCAFLPMYYAFPLNFMFILILTSNLKQSYSHNINTTN